LNGCEVPQTVPSAAFVHNLSNLMAEPILSKGYDPPTGCVPRRHGEMTKARLSITVSRPLGVRAASSIHCATRRRNGVSTPIDRLTSVGRPAFVRMRIQFERGKRKQTLFSLDAWRQYQRQEGEAGRQRQRPRPDRGVQHRAEAATQGETDDCGPSASCSAARAS
jgi:hypothetical protein